MVGFALVVVVGLLLRWWVLGTWVGLWVLSLVLDWTDGEDGVFQWWLLACCFSGGFVVQ